MEFLRSVIGAVLESHFFLRPWNLICLSGNPSRIFSASEGLGGSKNGQKFSGNDRKMQKSYHL